MRSVVALSLLVGHVVHGRRLVAPKTKVVHGNTGSSEMCSDHEINARACSVLAQSSQYVDESINSVSAHQLGAYFDARPSDVASFMDALHLSNRVSCAELCRQSLQFIKVEMKWSIPDEHGVLCVRPQTDGTCSSWEQVDETTVNEIASEIPPSALMPQEYDDDWVDNDLVHAESTNITTSGKCPLFCVASMKDTICEPTFHLYTTCKACGFCDCKEGDDCGYSDYFDYTVNELAVRIAEIFDVHPEDPADHVDYLQSLSKDGSSLMENDPHFGPRVEKDRYEHFNLAIASAQSWVRTALNKLPGTQNAIEAWFGGADGVTKEAVRRMMLGMAKSLENAKIKKGVSPCGPNSSTMAYVTTYASRKTGRFVGSEKENNRYVINVCDHYWKFVSRPSETYGTMVHEASHHHGTEDESFQGASPYGRAQCLRLAQLSSAAALNNADNFRWFTYYINRCADAPSRSDGRSPCSLKLVPESRHGTNFKIVQDCNRNVEAITLKFEDSEGNYLQKAMAFTSSNSIGSYVLGDFDFPKGTVVKLFFEYKCAMWEAQGTWRGSAGTYKSETILRLSSGGQTTSDHQPATNVSGVNVNSALALPCEIQFDTSARLADGTEAFKVLVKCSSTVINSRLEFGSSRLTWKVLESDTAWKLFTEKLAPWKGTTFTFFGSIGAKEGSVSAKLPGVPPTTTTTTLAMSNLTSLPCEIDSFLDESNMVVVTARCSIAVPNATLLFSAPHGHTRHKSAAVRSTLTRGKKRIIANLKPLQSFNGYTLILEAQVRGHALATTHLLAYDVAPTQPHKLKPHDIGSCAVYCEKQKPEKFCHESSYWIDECKGCQFCQDYYKQRFAKSFAVVYQPAPTPAPLPRPRHQRRGCRQYCLSTAYCDRHSLLYNDCRECSMCGHHGRRKNRNGNAIGRAYRALGRNRSSTVKSGRKPALKNTATAREDSNVTRQSKTFKAVADSSRLTSGKSNRGSNREDGEAAETTTDTCGKYITCDATQPEKMCKGWRKRYCGGCTFC